MKKFKKTKQPIYMSFKHAVDGIVTNLKKERNLMIHFFMMMLVIIFGLMFNINYSEWIICLILFGLVIALELVNTAIEVAVDICSPEINDKAKLAKDTSAGAVLVVSVIAFIIGLIIFIPKFVNLLEVLL